MFCIEEGIFLGRFPTQKGNKMRTGRYVGRYERKESMKEFFYKYFEILRNKFIFLAWNLQF
jgi:hypothetical protein